MQGEIVMLQYYCIPRVRPLYFLSMLFVSMGLMFIDNITCYHCKNSNSESMANITGDVIIAGMFPVHYLQTDKNESKSDYVINQVALTWIEALHFAVHTINSQKDILPGLKLGYVVRDSCNDQEWALLHALDFMLDQNFSELNKEAYRTDQLTSKRVHGSCKCAKNGRSKIMAVIGGASSHVSAAIGYLLGVDYLPQISYSSTSIHLSKRNRYRSFFRTVPPDTYQAKAIADFLQHFNWTYVSVLASDNQYGRLGLHELRRELKVRDMCMAMSMTFDPSMPTKELKDIISKLIDAQKKNANVVVLWSEINEAKTILKEVNRTKGLNNLTWIGSESWGSNRDLFELGELAHGIIGLKPTLHRIAEFERYLKQSNSSNFKHNPWLMHHLRQCYNCSSDSHSLPVESHSKTHSNLVLCHERRNYISHLPLNKYPNVISAVYVVANALHRLLDCNGLKCTKMVSDIEPIHLFDEIQKANFTLPGSKPSMTVQFGKNGDIIFASYTFTKLVYKNSVRKRIDRCHSVDSKLFTDIGLWDGKLNIYNNTLQDNKIRSQCSLPCKPGQHKVPDKVPCCWKCAPCTGNRFSNNGMMESCMPCPGNSIATANKTKCLAISELSFTSYTPSRLAIALVSMLGVILTFFVIITFLRNWETPVVKSSNRELTILQLCCIAILFCYPALYFWEASVTACITRYLYLALFSTTVISVIFVKTYRLWKVFKKTSTGHSVLLKSKYQPMYVLCLVLVQLMIYGFWRLNNSRVVRFTYDKKNRTQIKHCRQNEENLLLLFICYVFFMALASAFMAFRVRTLPDIFNEARFISFAMFIYCLLWVLYIPIYFTLKKDVITQAEVLCSINILTNLTLILTLHGNKVRITLFFPEQNTRDFFQRQTSKSVIRRSLLHGSKSPRGKAIRNSPVDVSTSSLQTVQESKQDTARESKRRLLKKENISVSSVSVSVQGDKDNPDNNGS